MDNDFEPPLRAHIVTDGDPRYPLLVIQGRFNYGLRINPETGDIVPTRLCICAASSDDTCICDIEHANSPFDYRDDLDDFDNFDYQ